LQLRSSIIATALINQDYWENSKWSFVNVERRNPRDKLNGRWRRNITVSFTNHSCVPIEVMVFMFYSDQVSIHVKPGLTTRHKNKKNVILL
jgi:hypothetical protein